MNDLISRQAAIDALYSVDEYNSRSVKAIKQLPPIQPKRGKWIDDGDPLMLTCGNCGYGVMRYNNTPFCPNCGQKKEVERDG